MKTFTITTSLALLVATISAAPSSKRQFDVSVTFNGADGASYFQAFPADDSVQPITNPLSVSSISSPGGGFCSFFGADGSETVVIGDETSIVAPPQVQVSGSCQTE
ncbi:hypothetical protein JMJ35_002291 [Cladonia borealis]|uniref:SSCRP protein n=1 Tax=Cladonia borealis TaxID=184061 RepID=A0AA39R4T7_9LECA|nr:hypothetical protein JMJ35_002291 [Cladonia borealis]